jgi:hypothetical protein
MDAKPFDLGATERVVKFFGGDKQKMLQAYQSGALKQFAPAPMDQTLLVAAGMLADHMRSAAMQQAAPQQTVAQQTFAPQPPMGAPPAPPAGLGATPQAAAMPPMDAAPQMGPPPQEMAPPQMEMPAEEMPMMAEGGMVSSYASGGGLSDVPVPDGMFDEPSNGGFDDGYAGGGMVAFAGGGAPKETDGQRQERLVLAAIPGTIVTSRQRSAAKNAQVGGVPNSFHKTDQARDFVPPPGMSLTEFGDRVKSILGSGHDVIYNSKGHFDHVHTEPGGKRSAAPIPREVDTTTFAGRGMSLEDQLAFSNSMFAGLPREAMELGKKSALEDLDAANIKKQEKLGRAAAMMAAGFTLMGESGPLSTSIAKAGATYMASLEDSKKEQKAAKNQAIRNLMAYEELDRKTATAALDFGIEAYKVGLTAEQQQRALDFQEKELSTRVSENEKDRAATLAAAKFRASNPDKFDRIIGAVLAANPGMSELEAMQQAQKLNLLGGSQSGMEGLVGVPPQTGGAGGQQPVLIGSRPV